MIYEQSEITELLNCEHCSHPYDEYYPPRILPCCEKTICYKCVQITQSKVKDNIFKCIACNQDEKIPSNGFIVNRAVVRLIAKQPKEISRGQEAEKLKQNIREVENLNNKLIFEMGNGEYLVNEDCKELRRQVQLAKEEKIQEINKHCDALFVKIDIFEEKCISKYNEMNEPKQKANELISLVNDSIQQQNMYMRQLNIDDKDTMARNEKMSELKEKIETERKNIKKSMFENQIMRFEANKTLLEKDFLGKLILGKFDLDKILCTSFKTIKLLDLNTGEFLKTFSGHSEWVHSVKQLSDNKIVTCSNDKSLKIWDILTGNCIKTILGHSQCVWGIGILTNDRIVSCSSDKTVRIWDVQSGICIKILNGHAGAVYSIATLSNELVLSGSEDKTIKLWNVDSGECLRTFLGHQNTVMCVENLSDERILSGSADNTIKIWNVNSGDCLSTLKGHTDWLRGIQVLSDERIISASNDKTIRIWCLKTNSCIKTIEGHSDKVRGIQMLSNEKVASCSLDNTIKIWDLASASCIKAFQSEYHILSIDVL